VCVCVWVVVYTLASGLAEEAPTAEQVAEPAEGSGLRREVPLLPRWPLGSRDLRATGDVKSSKKVRMAPPLTPAAAGASELAAPGVTTTTTTTLDRL